MGDARDNEAYEEELLDYEEEDEKVPNSGSKVNGEAVKKIQGYQTIPVDNTYLVFAGLFRIRAGLTLKYIANVCFPRLAEQKSFRLVGNNDYNLENLDGSFFGSSDEESSEAYTMNKDSEKRRVIFHMAGYRDGITAGQEAAAQEGYNVGYKESVLAGYKFGIVRGVSSALAFLPDELRKKLIDEQETGEKFQNLHDSVQGLSTEAALKLFYGTLSSKQREEKSGEEGPDSSLAFGSGSASGVTAKTDLGNYVTELSSLLDKSPKIEVRLDT